MSLHAISFLHVRYMSHATYILHYMSSVMDKLYLIHIIISILSYKYITQKFNTQFLAQAIRSPKHFRYNLVLKTEVLETRMDRSLAVHDRDHCSAHVLAQHFILLNSRLNEIFVESKNAQIGVRTGKLWSSEVGAADFAWMCEIVWNSPKLSLNQSRIRLPPLANTQSALNCKNSLACLAWTSLKTSGQHPASPNYKNNPPCSA